MAARRVLNMAHDPEFPDDELLEPGPDEDFIAPTELLDVVPARTTRGVGRLVSDAEPANDVTQRYLNEIGARPLLTPQEEFE